jgi:hypothetical protein
MTSQSTVEPQAQTGPIVARAGKYYRNTRYIMCSVLLLYGCWAIYDGFISWPTWGLQGFGNHENEKPKTWMDIKFNQVLGTLLPPGAIVLLVYSLRNSRGEYRLEGNVVHVPGHPPVPLSKIVKIDRELWDKKGIAYIEYKLDPADTRPAADREFMLDDFVYERQPTDEIFKAIEGALLLDRGIPSRSQESPIARSAPATRTPPAARQPATAQPQTRSAAAIPANKQPIAKPAAPQTAAKPAAPVTKPAQPKPAAPAPTAKPPAPAVRPTPTPMNKPAAAPVRPAPAQPTAKPAAPKTPPPPRTPPRPQM